MVLKVWLFRATTLENHPLEEDLLYAVISYRWQWLQTMAFEVQV